MKKKNNIILLLLVFLSGYAIAQPTLADTTKIKVFDRVGSWITTGSDLKSYIGVGSGAVATDGIWDAAGDIVQGTGANTAAKLPIGTASQQLRVNAGATALEYFTPSAGSGDVATDAIWDAKGDLAVGTGADTGAKLTVGTDGGQIYADASTATGLRWLPSVISPAQITGDQDNYSPTGWAKCQVLRISGDNGLRAITSLAATFDGDKKTIINVGSFAIYFPSQHPDGTAANRFADYGSDFILSAGKSVDVYYDGTDSRWRIASAVSDNSDRLTLKYSWAPSSTTLADHAYMQWLSSGTGAAISSSSAASGVPAYVGGSTGTTTTGNTILYMPKSVNQIGYYGDTHFSMACYLDIGTALSDATNTFSVLMSTELTPSSAASGNNSIGIRYTHGTNSGKWQAYCRDNAGAETTLDLGVTVAINTEYLLRFEIDKSRTEARFYLDGLMIGRITSNLPSAGSFGNRAVILKSAGTTSRTMKLFGYWIQLNYP